MPGTHVARILCIVGEIDIVENTVLVTNETICSDARRIEFDLKLHVLRDSSKRCTEFTDEHFLCLEQIVDVREVSVTAIGHLLHLRILEIAGAEAEYAEKHARLTLMLDESNHLCITRNTDVEVAIRREYYTVVTLSIEVLACHLVRELQSYGVDLSSAKDRIAALTDEEVRTLAGTLNTAPAGASEGLVILVLVGVILWLVLWRR